MPLSERTEDGLKLHDVDPADVPVHTAPWRYGHRQTSSLPICSTYCLHKLNPPDLPHISPSVRQWGRFTRRRFILLPRSTRSTSTFVIGRSVSTRCGWRCGSSILSSTSAGSRFGVPGMPAEPTHDTMPRNVSIHSPQDGQLQVMTRCKLWPQSADALEIRMLQHVLLESHVLEMMGTT